MHVTELDESYPYQNEEEPSPYHFIAAEPSTLYSLPRPLSLEEVYQELYPFSFFYARRFAGLEEAQDIVANVFSRLTLREKKFTRMAQARAYISACIRNECLDQIREEATRRRREKEWSTDAEEAWSKPEMLSEIAAKKLELIYREIEKLPARQKLVFKMIWLEDRKIEEVAKILGTKYITVKNQRNQALKTIRMALMGIWILVLFVFCN